MRTLRLPLKGMMTARILEVSLPLRIECSKLGIICISTAASLSARTGSRGLKKMSRVVWCSHGPSFVAEESSFDEDVLFCAVFVRYEHISPLFSIPPRTGATAALYLLACFVLGSQPLSGGRCTRGCISKLVHQARTPYITTCRRGTSCFP